MQRATIVDYEYKPSDCITKQGKRRDITRQYPDYHIKEDRNGFFVLTKPSRYEVTLAWNDGMETFEMRSGVLSHYNRRKATETLLETFVEDVENGNCSIWVDGDSYTIM